jgi:protein involved in plasmid replication-relaxation
MAATTHKHPSTAALAVLVALKDYHYLTVDQLMLLTNRTSLRASQRRLTDLAAAGLVTKHDRRSSNVIQPLRAAWSLTSKSKAYLEDANMVVLPPRRPRPYTLDHLLAINDVLIQAQVVGRDQPASLELRELYHDRDLRTWQPALPVVPDGFCHFVVTSAAGRESYPLLLEVDMGTMDRRRWQEKITRYVSFLAGGLPTYFETDVATIAVIVADTDKRVHDLKRWTEQELGRLGAAGNADLFYFTRLTPELSAQELFYSPRFLVGGTQETDALLPRTVTG